MVIVWLALLPHSLTLRSPVEIHLPPVAFLFGVWMFSLFTLCGFPLGSLFLSHTPKTISLYVSPETAPTSYLLPCDSCNPEQKKQFRIH